jgi:hypothetical protein
MMVFVHRIQFARLTHAVVFQSVSQAFTSVPQTAAGTWNKIMSWSGKVQLQPISDHQVKLSTGMRIGVGA